MNIEVEQVCNLLAENKQVICKGFTWSSATMNIAAAYILAANGVRANKEELKACEEILKNNTSALSEYRGNIKTILICKMIISKEPERYLEKVQKAYKLLTTKKWSQSEYKLIAAIIICDHTDESRYEEMVNRTNSLYAKMQDNHKWLTSAEDIPLAALLAVSMLDIDKLDEEMEKCYQLLRKTASDRNSAQTASHVLSVYEGDAQIKCDKVKAVISALKAAKCRFGSGHEISIVAALTMLDYTPEQIAQTIAETENYLKSLRGFGSTSIDARTRRLFAAEIILSQNGESRVAEGAMLTGVLAMTIAMEICMLAVITACISTTSVNS